MDVSKLFREIDVQNPLEWLEKRHVKLVKDCNNQLQAPPPYPEYDNETGAVVAATRQEEEISVVKHDFDNKTAKGLADTYRAIVDLVDKHTSVNMKTRRRRRNAMGGGICRRYNRRYDSGALVPVHGRKDSLHTVYFSEVDKTPALTVMPESVLRSYQDFLDRFLGGHSSEFDASATVPAPLLIKDALAKGVPSFCQFNQIARNVFINNNTKTTLVFLNGTEQFKYVDFLFSAFVSSVTGLAQKVGCVECVAFYPDLMCAEFGFVGIGLKEISQDCRIGIIDKKLRCMGGNVEEEYLYDITEDLNMCRQAFVSTLPYTLIECNNIAKRLHNLGIVMTRGTPNNFALEVYTADEGRRVGVRPLLVNLSGIVPNGLRFRDMFVPQRSAAISAPETKDRDGVASQATCSYVMGKIMRETIEVANSIDCPVRTT